VAINSSPKPDLLYDYYGFPEHTYKLKYDAPGSPELAENVRGLLTKAQIPTRLIADRGLDHGVFIPLKLVYPEADIPIVQVSLMTGLDPGKHIEIGQALAPLRQQGVLIVGSGMSYHNLRRFGDGSEDQSSIEFDEWLKNSVCQTNPDERNQLLCQWQNAPSARAAHPREEHLIPLMVAAGAGEDDMGQAIYSERVSGMAISGFQFG